MCGAPVESTYTALTASHRLIVSEDGEKRYGDEPTLIVAVGPLVVHVDARVALFVGDGRGVAVARGAGLLRCVGVDVDGPVVATWCLLATAWVEEVGEAGVDALDATVVGMGGVGDPCTSTFADPLLHPVTASMNPRAAATFPLFAMPA